MPDNKPINITKSIAATIRTDKKINVEYLQVTTEDNITLDAWINKPKNFDPSKKYPVVLYVYGEPAASTVQNSYGNHDIDEARTSAMEVSDYPRAMGYLGKIDVATLAEPEPILNAALNLLNRRRSADAAVLLTRVIERFPDAADAYFYRAYGSIQANKPADAKPDLEKYLALAPNGAQATQAKDLLATIR